MSGYTIDQLLAWSLEDHLIDGYDVIADGRIEILLDGRRHVLQRRSAEKLLCDLMRRIAPKTPDPSTGTT